MTGEDTTPLNRIQDSTGQDTTPLNLIHDRTEYDSAKSDTRQKRTDHTSLNRMQNRTGLILLLLIGCNLIRNLLILEIN